MSIGTDYEKHSIKYLLTINDLKLLSEADDALSLITKKIIQFFDVVNLEINKNKSATNFQASADTVLMLEGKTATNVLK
ncbi:hypothetical protein PAEPH01_0407 [Pancytospora epiphaga]|nr:hypothetical protein PAEPH01_0407 [Pancytospora epiphaga]